MPLIECTDADPLRSRIPQTSSPPAAPFRPRWGAQLIFVGSWPLLMNLVGRLIPALDLVI